MPASTSMTVALLLTATNTMSSVLKSAGNQVVSFGSQISKASEDVSKYDQKIASLESSIKRFNNLKSSGMQDIQGGMMMLVPTEELLRYAGSMEAVMNDVENAIYDSTVPMSKQKQIMSQLTEQANELGNISKFNNVEAAEAQLALIKNGTTYKDVLEGGAVAAVYLAQTAKTSTTVTGDAVSQIANMFQLQGSQLLQVADDINRAANASSAGVGNIMADLQQTGMTAHLLGLEVKDTTLLLGTLHNLGLGDSSGTYLNDMLINLDKVTPKARNALQAMGWLEGATVKTLSSGKIQISGGTNSLFDENGQIRSAEKLVAKLREVLYTNSGLKPEDFRDQSGNLLPQEQIEEMLGAKNKLTAMQQFKDVFGVQGMRAAIALATPGKGSYEEMVTQAERAKNIQDQVMSWQETFFGKMETLKGTYETIMTQQGSPLTKELGNTVSQVTDLLNAFGKFANENPKLITGLIKLFSAFAVGKVLVGAFKYSLGALGGFISGTSKVLTVTTRSAHGLYDAFKFFRTESGVFRSLWQAVAFGHPTLTRIITAAGRLGTGFVGTTAKVLKGGGSMLGTVTRIGGGFLSLGAQALKAGGRMALAWLIGLGPVGWAILGVTALVVAGIAAWRTNFLGFKDFCLDVLQRIVDGVNKVRVALKMEPIKLEILESRYQTSMGDFKQLEYSSNKPAAAVKTGTSNDNRQYNFNITSNDPQEVAKEVSKVVGGKGVDKYTASRDPRFSSVWLSGAGAM